MTWTATASPLNRSSPRKRNARVAKWASKSARESTCSLRSGSWNDCWKAAKSRAHHASKRRSIVRVYPSRFFVPGARHANAGDVRNAPAAIVPAIVARRCIIRSTPSGVDKRRIHQTLPPALRSVGQIFSRAAASAPYPGECYFGRAGRSHRSDKRTLPCRLESSIVRT